MQLPLPALLVIVLAAFAAGAVLGWLALGWRERRAGGGRSAAEIAAELERYRSEVEAHFQRSAELFQGLTEQYRALYRHMGESATALGVTGGEAGRLTADAFQPLPAPDPAAEAAAEPDDSGTPRAEPQAPSDAPASSSGAPPAAGDEGPAAGQDPDTPPPDGPAQPSAPAADEGAGDDTATTAGPAGSEQRPPSEPTPAVAAGGEPGEPARRA